MFLPFGNLIPSKSKVPHLPYEPFPDKTVLGLLGFFLMFLGVVLTLGVGVAFCSPLAESHAEFSGRLPSDLLPEFASSEMTMAGEVAFAFMSSEGCCFLAAS